MTTFSCASNGAFFDTVVSQISLRMRQIFCCDCTLRFHCLESAKTTPMENDFFLNKIAELREDIYVRRMSEFVGPVCSEQMQQSSMYSHVRLSHYLLSDSRDSNCHCERNKELKIQRSTAAVCGFSDTLQKFPFCH